MTTTTSPTLRESLGGVCHPAQTSSIIVLRHGTGPALLRGGRAFYLLPSFVWARFVASRVTCTTTRLPELPEPSWAASLPTLRVACVVVFAGFFAVFLLGTSC